MLLVRHDAQPLDGGGCDLRWHRHGRGRRLDRGRAVAVLDLRDETVERGWQPTRTRSQGAHRGRQQDEPDHGCVQHYREGEAGAELPWGGDVGRREGKEDGARQPPQATCSRGSKRWPHIAQAISPRCAPDTLSRATAIFT